MKSVKVYGTAEDGALEQAENCLHEAEAMLLMADNHQGYGMPIGGVAVYKDKISPAGVGFDIACGNLAVGLDIHIDNLPDDMSELADEIAASLSFGVGRKNTSYVDSSFLDGEKWDRVPFLKDNEKLRDKARSQLGTIGSGNHYVNVFADEEGMIWVGVHFGSRGFGHTIASHFMQLAGDNVNIMASTPSLIDVNSQDGQDYINAMNLAGEYAYSGREWVCDTVAGILGGNMSISVHNHHNFAWKETHFGEEYWVVRKGATPAFPGQYGFVGSSMGDDSVILMGLDTDENRDTFYSTVHGAGRVMSRTKAAGKFKKETVTRTKPDGTEYSFKERRRMGGLVDFDAVKDRLKGKKIVLRGGGADEAPEVYKKLPEVLSYHEKSVKVMNRLTPLIVVMAGSDEFDPYKD